jgi:methionyl-tRNA synthetase
MNKFYVTTPIYYVNDAPHIGHAYTTLAADIIARHYRLKYGSEHTFFLTGTDEHGFKVAQAAQERGKTPQQFADETSHLFSENWKNLNISNDFFIRTTNKKHEKVAQDILQKIYDKGFIYEDIYKGLYCVGCERFLTENDLADGKCPLHPNKDPIYQEEKNYFFKLKKFIPEVLKRIETDSYKILPLSRKNEVVSKLKQGVEDVSVSRAGVSWGISVPWDNSQTIYVWVEALINYYSATQFLEGKEKFWPADLHLMAKDILWFHAVIWPALLLAADLPLPKTLFAHGFFTINGQKMSKSLGNVISSQELIDQFGVDGTRYLLMSEYPFGNDGDLSLEKFKQRYNSDLANGLGNLTSRVAKLCENVGDFPIEKNLKVRSDISNLIEEYKFDEALKMIQLSIAAADKIVNEKKPWTLEGDKLKDVLLDLVARIRQISKDLESFMPETSDKIWQQFGAEKISLSAPLFPRK